MEQDLVEVFSVLYLKLPNQKHPVGLFEFEISSATTSLKPKLVAAVSHAALLNIDFLPVTSLQLLFGLGYPNAPTSFLRQEPPPIVE